MRSLSWRRKGSPARGSRLPAGPRRCRCGVPAAHKRCRDRHARRCFPAVMSRPRKTIFPSTAFCSPKIRRPSSDRPDPTRPAMPTISRARPTATHSAAEFRSNSRQTESFAGPLHDCIGPLRLLDVAADDQPNQFRPVEAGDRAMVHQISVAKHCDLVGDFVAPRRDGARCRGLRRRVASTRGPCATGDRPR